MGKEAGLPLREDPRSWQLPLERELGQVRLRYQIRGIFPGLPFDPEFRSSFASSFAQIGDGINTLFDAKPRQKVVPVVPVGVVTLDHLTNQLARIQEGHKEFEKLDQRYKIYVGQVDKMLNGMNPGLTDYLTTVKSFEYVDKYYSWVGNQIDADYEYMRGLIRSSDSLHWVVENERFYPSGLGPVGGAQMTKDQFARELDKRQGELRVRITQHLADSGMMQQRIGAFEDAMTRPFARYPWQPATPELMGRVIGRNLDKFIRQPDVREHGFSPAFGEIARGFGDLVGTFARPFTGWIRFGYIGDPTELAELKTKKDTAHDLVRKKNKPGIDTCRVSDTNAETAVALLQAKMARSAIARRLVPYCLNGTSRNCVGSQEREGELLQDAEFDAEIAKLPAKVC